MWRLYVGGLCTGFAIGGAVCWLAALSMAPESARGNLISPAFPWLVLLAFVLAGETLRVKAKRFVDPKAPPNTARKQGGPAEPLHGLSDLNENNDSLPPS